MCVSKTLAMFAFAIASLVTTNAQQVRNIDGTENNLNTPNLGASSQPVQVLTSLDYSNQMNSPGGANRANARNISNEIFSTIHSFRNHTNLSQMVWAFGAFIEHDISYFETSKEEKLYVKIPQCDKFFDPECAGAQNLVFYRLRATPGTGSSVDNPRSVSNRSTAWIDGSPIYGSDSLTAHWLRSGQDGKLKVSENNMLPFNTIDGQYNSPSDSTAPFMIINTVDEDRYFIAGDPRANNNLVILGLHTLFVREHNRLCDKLKQKFPGYSDEALYQKARSLLIGKIQNIVFNQWLPAIGVNMGAYRGYNPAINPNISNEFCAAGFKIWNTLQDDHISLMNERCEPHRLGNLDYHDIWFNPHLILQTNVGPLFKGMASRKQLYMDNKAVDIVRNFSLDRQNIHLKTDWITRDIVLGRERGIPDYNTLRTQLGLAPIESFSELSADPELQRKLQSVYNNDIHNIDAWVGLVLEEQFPGSLLGETTNVLFTDQFTRLQRGDRFYFENDPSLSETERQEIRQSTLSDIIRANTRITFLQENIFKYDPYCLEAEVIKKHLQGTVFPNPVANVMDLSLYSDKDGPASMKILNTRGVVVNESIIQLEHGENFVHCDIDDNLAAGLYIIRIMQEQQTGILKFIKLN